MGQRFVTPCFWVDLEELMAGAIEIRYSFYKGPYSDKSLKEDCDENSRRYLRRPYKLTLKQVNRPKPKRLADIVRHPSEEGWNLPVENARHFNKLPVGTLSFLFAYARGAEVLIVAGSLNVPDLVAQ